jgi:hypothetical protein
MPKEKAATPEAAAALLREEWMRATAATFPQSHVEFHDSQAERMRSQSYVSVTGESCSECRIFALAVEDRRVPRMQKAPAVLGSYDAYAWGGPGAKGDGLLGGYPLSPNSLTPEERVAVFQNFSRNLPAWIYVYVPPGPRLAPFPQIFHHGQQLLFIEPGAYAPTAADSQAPAH